MKLDLTPPWNFFGLTGTPDAPVLHRLPVTADLQEELSRLFAGQLKAFHADHPEVIEYSPDYRPDDDQLLSVRGFSLPDSFPDLTSARDLPPLSDEQIEAGSVRALVGVPQQGAARSRPLCFQAIDQRQLLQRSRFSLFLSGQVFRRSEQSGLVVREALTAVLQGGTLLFPSEPPVRRFLDLSVVFQEATDPQVTAFLRHPAFSVRDEATLLDLADGWTRRKIVAIEARGLLESLNPEVVLKVGQEFGVRVASITVKGRRRLLVSPVKQEFKDLLRLLDQDFLRSPLTEDRFRVNSKRKV